MTKWVYFFGAGKAEGKGEWRDLLGGKGAGLAEMTRIGLPVPAGFTISTEACDDFYKSGKKFNNEVKKQVADNVAKLEKVTKKKLGDPKNPLLVSVRSGSARSMPGMMETILNLGLNDKSVEGLAEVTKNERFAYDAYRRFVQMYSTVVMNMSKEDLEHRLRALKTKLGVKEDTAVPASGWKELVGEYKAYYKEQAGKTSPKIPWTSCGERSARCLDRGWQKRPSPIAALRRSPDCSARASTCSRWCSAIRATIPARAFASRATRAPARRFSMAII